MGDESSDVEACSDEGGDVPTEINQAIKVMNRSTSSCQTAKNGSSFAWSGFMRRESAVGLRHCLHSVELSGRSENSRRPQLEKNRNEVSHIGRHGAPCFTEDLDSETVNVQEFNVRKKVKLRSSFVVELQNILAAMKVFAMYFVSASSVFTSILSTGLTVYFFLEMKSNNSNIKDGTIAMNLLTFAIVVPVASAVRMAFNRREKALCHIAKFRSYAFQVYLAHATWDWNKGDRRRETSKINWQEHADEVMKELIGIGDELCRFLTLPTSSRTRHRFTQSGREEAQQTLVVAFRLFDSLNMQRFVRLSKLDEHIKREGLTETETSRIRQFERAMGESIHTLRLIKSYRTPEALRTFACVYVVFLPPLYAPNFAQLAYNLGSLGWGITFAVITSMGLSALYDSIEALEDPFVGFTQLDGIDVKEELMVLHWQQLVNAREEIFPKAATYPSPSALCRPSALTNIRSITSDDPLGYDM